MTDRSILNCSRLLSGTLLTVALATGCQGDAVHPPATQPPTPQITLLSVSLRPDGTLAIAEARHKPIRHVGPTLPFIAMRHDPEVAARSLGKATDSSTPGAVAQGVADAQDSETLIVVRHPSLVTPVVVPVRLGAPGEAHGDVLDPWQHGALLLRAPDFGPGTSYDIVRVSGERPTRLARTDKVVR